MISARTTGHVTRVLVSEGDRVRAGQTLVEIDNRDAAVQVRRAEAGESEARESLAALDQEITAAEFGRAAADANRKLAASTFERYRTLHDRRSVSDQEFDEVQAKLSAATAEMERANAMLESAKARRNQMLARIDQANGRKVRRGSLHGLQPCGFARQRYCHREKHRSRDDCVSGCSAADRRR